MPDNKNSFYYKIIEQISSYIKILAQNDLNGDATQSFSRSAMNLLVVKKPSQAPTKKENVDSITAVLLKKNNPSTFTEVSYLVRKEFRETYNSHRESLNPNIVNEMQTNHPKLAEFVLHPKPESTLQVPPGGLKFQPIVPFKRNKI